MAKTKEIQRRIKSVRNTKKITKAMEMVAASKMRRAVEAVLKTRTYANLSWTTVFNLVNLEKAQDKPLHPLLLRKKKVSTIGIILISSNRGLCGGFNAAILAKAHQSVLKYHHLANGEEIKTEFIVIGKKGLAAHSRHGYHIAAEFAKTDVIYESKDIVHIARMVINDFITSRYDKVMVAYTDYVNPMKQVPRVKQLLPIDIDARDDHLGIVGGDTRVGVDPEFLKEKEEKYLSGEEKYNLEFIFEPSPEAVLEEMLPRLIEIQLFQALLESNASEHSARMSTMHQATESASDLVNELTLFYNKARQSSITSEIAEISAGVNALKNS